MTTATETRPAPARDRIDPRIRARRVAVRRDEGRRRLRRLVALVVFISLVAIAYATTRSPLLDVDHVKVDGAAHTNADAIVTASRINTRDAMTDVATGRARAEIATLPWVDTVRVEKHWPGTVEIHVTERVAAAALVANNGEWSVVDATGRVLEHTQGAAAGLPVVAIEDAAVAPGAHQPAISGALDLVRQLTPDLAAWVETVRPSADGTVDLQLRQGIHVELGSQAHLDDKLTDLATVLTRVDLAGLATIDLSVVHTPVVTRKAP